MLPSSPRRLQRIFETILASALVSTGCTRLQSSDFSTDVCPAGDREPIAAATPGIGVDYLELREVSTSAMGSAPRVVSMRGTPCATATSAAACATALAAPRPTTGWPQTAGDREPTVRYLVFTRGDEVGAVTSLDALGSFLAPIETGAEAAFLVTQTNLNLECGSNNLRAAGTGFELLANTGFACGAGTHRDANLVSVSREGVLRLLDTEVIERGSSNCAAGRRPEGFSLRASDARSLGAWFAEMATLEAASVPAFRRLARELRALGAPAALVTRAERAMRDEVRHARITRALARRFGATPSPVVRGPSRVRSRLEVARENAVEGCVRETFGALVATLQVRRARDPEIAAAMREIARDETRHAALAWAVAAWIEPTLRDDERASLRDARKESAAQLARDLRHEPPAEAMRLAGAPSAREALALFAAMAAA